MRKAVIVAALMICCVMPAWADSAETYDFPNYSVSVMLTDSAQAASSPPSSTVDRDLTPVEIGPEPLISADACAAYTFTVDRTIG